MKRNLSYISLVVSLVALLCGSCSRVEDVRYEVVGDEPLVVAFSMDAATMSGTRADDNTWGGDYSSIEGSDFENRIDLSTLKVFTYSADGEFLAELPIIHSEDTDGVVGFVCAFPPSFRYVLGETYRFMVIANCTSRSYGISYTNNVPSLERLIYATPLTANIPMWGVKAFEFPTTMPKNRKLEIGMISVLRATAKIGVRLSEEVAAEGWKISGLKLNYANANGYSLPAEWNSANNTENMVRKDVFRPNPEASLMTNISATTMGLNTGSYNIYVPETKNNSLNYNESITTDLAIAVELNRVENGIIVESVTFPYEKGIRFCNYSNGQPTDDRYDIVRNHFYDYTITEVNIGLKMNLVVAEWEDEPVWNLDLSVPIHTNLMTAPDKAAPQPDVVPTVRYDNSDASGEAGAFVGYFMMESPEGTTWRPTLINASAVDYEVRVYKTNGTDAEYDVLVTSPAIEAEANNFYKIVVVAKNPNNIGNVIKLGLTYTADWNAEANPLLIINKGGNNGLYYPWDGTNPSDEPDIHWISIRQE
jgi:hypothetical protein